MPGYSHVLLDKNPSDHIAWLTINRPERRNAIDGLTVGELGDVLGDIEADDYVRPSNCYSLIKNDALQGLGV